MLVILPIMTVKSGVGDRGSDHTLSRKIIVILLLLIACSTATLEIVITRL